jgi:hypothetical protein
MQREHFSLFTDFACDHLDNRREISILLAPLAAFAPNGQPRSFPPWGYCAADRAVALFLGARDWRAAEASLQVPALARFLERSRPASQLARCGGNRARSRSLLGALATCFATRSLWCGCRQPAFACATLDMAEGGAQRSLSSRDGSRSSCRVALPPCEAGGSGLRCKHGRPSKSKLGTQCEPESRHHQR